MRVTLQIPEDPAECRRLLEDLLRRNDALRQQAEDAREQAEDAGQRAENAGQRAENAGRRIDELERVLDQTAAEYERLRQQNAELAETLALLRRYLFGRRRERFLDDPGQGHLFDVPESLPEPEPASTAPARRGAAAIQARPSTAANPPGSSRSHPHRARPARGREDLLLLRRAHAAHRRG